MPFHYGDYTQVYIDNDTKLRRSCDEKKMQPH